MTKNNETELKKMSFAIKLTITLTVLLLLFIGLLVWGNWYQQNEKRKLETAMHYACYEQANNPQNNDEEKASWAGICKKFTEEYAQKYMRVK